MQTSPKLQKNRNVVIASNLGRRTTCYISVSYCNDVKVLTE